MNNQHKLLLVALLSLMCGLFFRPQERATEPATAPLRSSALTWALDPEQAVSSSGRGVAVFANIEPPEIANLSPSTLSRYGWLLVPQEHWEVWEESIGLKIRPYSVVLLEKTQDGKVAILERAGEVFHPVSSPDSFYP